MYLELYVSTKKHRSKEVVFPVRMMRAPSVHVTHPPGTAEPTISVLCTSYSMCTLRPQPVSVQPLHECRSLYLSCCALQALPSGHRNSKCPFMASGPCSNGPFFVAAWVVGTVESLSPVQMLGPFSLFMARLHSYMCRKHSKIESLVLHCV